MEKYGVKTEDTMKKHASEGDCPSCGTVLNTKTNPPKCPRCGTEPFEPGLDTRKQDGRT